MDAEGLRTSDVEAKVERNPPMFPNATWQVGMQLDVLASNLCDHSVILHLSIHLEKFLLDFGGLP